MTELVAEGAELLIDGAATVVGKNKDIDMDDCNATITPSITEYFRGIKTVILVLTIICIIFCVVTCIFGIIHVVVIIKKISSDQRRLILICLAGIFPVATICAVTGLCIPRALTYIDTIILTYFAVALLAYVCLVREVFGGVENVVKMLGRDKISLNSNPFCCCKCLPKLAPTQRNVRRVEFLVIQGAIVRPLLIIVGCIMYLEFRGQSDLITRNVFNSISSISGLIAIWGANVLADLTMQHVKHTGVPTLTKFLQLTLVIYNIQQPIFELLQSCGVFSCYYPVSSDLNASIYHHITQVFEMFICSLILTVTFKPSQHGIFDLAYEPKDEVPPENGGQVQQETEFDHKF